MADCLAECVATNRKTEENSVIFRMCRVGTGIAQGRDGLGTGCVSQLADEPESDLWTCEGGSWNSRPWFVWC